jgi:hypothetical protein
MGANTTGSSNTATGNNALAANGTGNNNTASGNGAAAANTTGSNNTAIGTAAMPGNITGSFNTIVGDSADVLAGNLSNATAIGHKAAVGCSSCLVLGSNDVSVGVGTSNPTRKLDVNGSVRIGTNGTTLANVIKVTVSKDIAAIGGGATLTLTFAVPNAGITSSVLVSPGGSLPNGLFLLNARVSAPGVVEVKCYNSSNVSVNPAAMDFHITAVE